MPAAPWGEDATVAAVFCSAWVWSAGSIVSGPVMRQGIMAARGRTCSLCGRQEVERKSGIKERPNRQRQSHFLPGSCRLRDCMEAVGGFSCLWDKAWDVERRCQDTLPTVSLSQGETMIVSSWPPSPGSHSFLLGVVLATQQPGNISWCPNREWYSEFQTPHLHIDVILSYGCNFSSFSMYTQYIVIISFA